LGPYDRASGDRYFRSIRGLIRAAGYPATETQRFEIDLGAIETVAVS
jgi:hypothetical protein